MKVCVCVFNDETLFWSNTGNTAIAKLKVLPHEKPALLEKAVGTNRADCTSELLGRFKEAQHLLKGQLLLRLQPKKNSTFQLDRFLWFHYVLLQSIRITMLHDIFAGWWMAESPKIHGKTGRCQRGIRFGPGWCFRPTRRLCEFEMWIIPCLSHIHSSIIMPYGINHVKYVFFCGIQNKWNIME